MRLAGIGAVVFGAMLVVGCGDDDDDVAVDAGAADGGAVDARAADATAVDSGRASAMSTLAPKSGNTTLGGTATFTRNGANVDLVLNVTGAPVGVHGAHIHATGDCSAADAMSAGVHWNPANVAHGMPGATTHLGDLGNITIASNGTGTLNLSSTRWRIGDSSIYDVVGKAIIIHTSADDFTTQPTGNSGSRIGCGVIN